MSLDFVDRFQDTLASGYTAGGGTLTLTSGTGLPSGACNLYLIVRAEGINTEEVFHVTNRSTVTLTVTGAQANTTASDHSSGAVVIASIMTAAAFSQFSSDISAVSALVRIQQQVLVSTVPTITLSSIPSGYTDLIISLMGRTDANADNDILMTANSDGAANYDTELIAGLGGTVVLAAQNGVSAPTIAKLPGSTATAGYAGIAQIVIANYTGTTFHKQALSSYGLRGSNEFAIQVWWQWKNTSAITQLDLTVAGGNNYIAGTTLTLWGRT